MNEMTRGTPLLGLLTRTAGKTIRALDFLGPLLDLGIRLWVANVFWKAGLTKISNWDSTVSLFENEYDVPLLAPVHGHGGVPPG